MDTTSMKPFAMGVVAGVLDMYYMGETDMVKTIYFGAAVATGSYLAELAAPLAKDVAGFIPSANKSIYDSKTLAERIMEIGGASVSIYILNRYIIRNDTYKGEVMKRLTVIAASDVIATYGLEYYHGKPLEFFTNE